MPQTPGMKALPFVEPEFQKLHQILQQSPGVSADISMRPTRSDVLQKLTDYQIVHFSCHGWADEDPSESTLLLHDWRTNPLTVSDLSAQNLPKALFAFLSACNTASSFNEALIDESITLSAAIHLAGFPSVIGTLWPIFDQEGAEVAIEFYEWMLQNEGRFDVEKFAEGLHRVVRALKEKTQIVRGFKRRVLSNPVVWASFIYVGI
jgi:CHAT domain-containing protein